MEGWYDEDFDHDEEESINSEEANNEDHRLSDTTNLCNDDVFHWASMEEEVELYQAASNDYPKVDSWKDIETGSTVSIVIDRAREDLKRLLEAEVKALRAGHGIEGRKKMDDIAPDAFEKMFGENSKFALLFVRRLGWSYDKLFGFLATFFIQCAYHASVKELYSPTSELSTAGLMERDGYILCWKEIKNAGLESRCSKPFWIDVEEACNDTFRQVFTCHLTENVNKLVALDDDKATFAALPGTKYEENLKLVHHASDKRMGFTCHSMVATCSGMPIFIRWERDGDTTTTCYAEMVKEAFGNGCGLNALVLTGIMFCSDRGYWTQALLFGLLLKCGKYNK